MKNSDKVTHVGYTVGGNSPKGNLTAKVRFTTSDSNYALRTKELAKMGASEIWFVPLPTAMTKSEALSYLKSRNDSELNNPVIQDAIAHATKRLLNK